MKKITTFIMLTLLAITFTSCENEDDQIARDLDGIWAGTISQEYCSWRGYKTIYQDAEIEFFANPNFCAEGKGVEYDYDRTGRTYVQNNFYFYVRNGRIFIDYEYGMDVVIDDYKLNGDIFDGYFREWYNSAPGYEKYTRWDTGRTLAHFEFDRVESWRYNNYRRYDYWGTRAK